MKDEQSSEVQEINYTSKGLLFGMIFGVAWGLVLSAVTDNPAFLSIGIGSGLAIGVGIGSSMQRRYEQEQGASLEGEDGEEGAEQG